MYRQRARRLQNYVFYITMRFTLRNRMKPGLCSESTNLKMDSGTFRHMQRKTVFNIKGFLFVMQ